jgi:hypothetical protein
MGRWPDTILWRFITMVNDYTEIMLGTVHPLSYT